MRFLEPTGFLPTADELAPLTEDQNIAILESLFLAVIADGVVDAKEVTAFATSALTYPFNWGTGTEVVQQKLDAIGGRLTGVSRETMREHLRGLGPRIPTAILREKTFAGMFALMIADGRLDEKEKAAAIAFASVFDIPHPRAVEIIQIVLDALVATTRK